jgi:predicted transcriptional regulator of viral defense system
MSRPTRRDEAWHAVLVTASESGLEDSFDADDVVVTADELDVEVAERTIRKALRVMVDFGYLRELDAGEYRLSPVVVSAVSTQRDLQEVLGR